MKHVILLLLAAGLPLIVYYNTIGANRDKQYDHDLMQLKELNIRVEQARAAERKLPQFHEELARLDTEVTKLRTILPPTMDIDGIRAMTEAKAAESGVRVTKFDVRENQSIDAEVTGSTGATAKFFREVQDAPRIIDFTYVTMRKDAAGWRTDFVMTGYALPDSKR